MRYWKGAYDEDIRRDFEMRQYRGLPADEENRDVWVFRVLVAIQVVWPIVVGLLCLSSR